MDILSYKTSHPKKENVERKWILIDASNKPLGRLASEIAKLLMGKNKSFYSPAVDCSDFVIIINSEKVSLSGKKWSNKSYIRHTGYPGGQKSLSAKELYDKDPTRLIFSAVKGMLPKNRLSNKLLGEKLKVYVGSTHKHEAQKPIICNI